MEGFGAPTDSRIIAVVSRIGAVRYDGPNPLDGVIAFHIGVRRPGLRIAIGSSTALYIGKIRWEGDVAHVAVGNVRTDGIGRGRRNTRNGAYAHTIPYGVRIARYPHRHSRNQRIDVHVERLSSDNDVEIFRIRTPPGFAVRYRYRLTIGCAFTDLDRCTATISVGDVRVLAAATYRPIAAGAIQPIVV